MSEHNSIQQQVALSSRSMRDKVDAMEYLADLKASILQFVNRMPPELTDVSYNEVTQAICMLVEQLENCRTAIKLSVVKKGLLHLDIKEPDYSIPCEWPDVTRLQSEMPKPAARARTRLMLMADCTQEVTDTVNPNEYVSYESRDHQGDSSDYGTKAECSKYDQTAKRISATGLVARLKKSDQKSLDQKPIDQSVVERLEKLGVIRPRYPSPDRPRTSSKGRTFPFPSPDRSRTSSRWKMFLKNDAAKDYSESDADCEKVEATVKCHPKMTISERKYISKKKAKRENR